MLLCLPVLGVTLFEKPSATKPHGVRLLHFKRKGLTAEGYETEDGFVVRKNSEASLGETAAIQEKARTMRTELKQQSVLVEQDGKLRFAQDYSFNSPSLAASVIAASSCNGREEWKNSDGKSLKKIQEQQSAAAADPDASVD
jgi:hypothetical protein